MSFITAIGTAVPENRLSQSAIAEFMVKAMNLDYEDSRKLRFIFKSSGISHRHSVLNDYGKTKDFSFYRESFDPFPSTEDRIGAYREHALNLSSLAVKNCVAQREEFEFKAITHLIVVSCTGMYAPGLDIDLVKALPLREDVNRLCINFMGCYAAFNAIKSADAFIKADPAAHVLIVCAEMCSLHFQKEATNDNLLANALFADGAAALLVEAKAQQGWNFSLESFHNALAYNGVDHMAWNVGNLGFEMRLSSYVPDVIQAGIKNLTDGLLSKLDKKLTDVKYYAIHPGGKKILEVIETQLGLTPSHNKHAYDVLQNFGNMSSPTVLFVLNSILKQLDTSDEGSFVLSFAFGPGLTMESMILKIHRG